MESIKKIFTREKASPVYEKLYVKTVVDAKDTKKYMVSKLPLTGYDEYNKDKEKCWVKKQEI
jgi:hypothetical protein